MKKNKNAFTLIELMVVMAIIAVLLTIVFGAIRLAKKTSLEATHRANAATLRTAMEIYYSKYRVYCNSDTGGVIPCSNPTGGHGISFQFAAGANAYGMGSELKLTESTQSGACSGVSGDAATRGGGQIVASKTGYEIRVLNHDCSKYILAYSTKVGCGGFPDSPWCNYCGYVCSFPNGYYWDELATP